MKLPPIALLWCGVVLMLLAGCGTDPKPAAADAVAEVGADTGDGSAEPDTGADAVAADESAPDAIEDSSADVAETMDSEPVDSADSVDTFIDTAPADVSQCTTATECAGKVTLAACQDALCDLGVCKPIPKPFPSCCNSAACDDKDECTADVCDATTHLCKNTLDPLCCSGKKTLLKSSFEANALDGLKASDAATNGNVGWQVSTARAHSGKSSLYFGNSCKTYDTSMTNDNGCKAGKEAQAVATTLASGSNFIPEGKKAHLVFWLWLDTEPPYSAQFKAATCKPACPQGAGCLLINEVPQCLSEKDVLTLTVVEGGKAAQVFSSVQIGKSTKGQWQQIAIDLSEWAGKTVKMQWTFASGSGLKNEYEGIYLDDIVWETVCAQAYCDASSPCKDDANACTADSCSPYLNGAVGAGSGSCLYAKASGCCDTDSDCDDANACTVDLCKNGQCTNNPDAAKPACCKSAVTYYAPFDDALTDWTTLQQNSTTVGWKLSPNGGETGGALVFADEAGASYADSLLGEEVGAKGVVCSKLIAIKSGSVFNNLTFQLNLDTEWSLSLPANYVNPPIAGLAKFDEFTVQVLAATQVTTIWSSDLIYGTTKGKWKTITVPLDAWQGQSVQVCLHFDAGDGSKNEFSGAAVDELAVKVACTKQLCYLDAECATKVCGSCHVGKCDASNGCICAKVASCCAGVADCDDKNDCTTDACAANLCTYTKKTDCPPKNP